jgi:vacuolar-type H+-ATPase subunit H
VPVEPARGEVIVIEIQLLLDRLEAILVESRQLPFLPGVLVDRDRCFDIINQMRISIPEEVKKAKRMQQERERIIAHANEEAERIIALARAEAASLVDEHAIAEQAAQASESVLGEAEREAEKVRTGADDYALTVLQQLEDHLLQQLTTVRNGISTLNRGARDPS